MKTNRLFNNHPLMMDVIDDYSSTRTRGYSRQQSVDSIYERFQDEWRDEDERPFLLIALALALCKKSELTQEIRSEALKAIECLKANDSFDEIKNKTFDYESLIRVLSESKIGPEAKYTKRTPYDPGWMIGDTFAHLLTQPCAVGRGLAGLCVLFRKVGEYTDRKGQNVQLVYVTVCPPDSIPKTDEELRSLGFLRMMRHDAGWDYLGQLHFRSKRDQERWGLQKIGCFPNAGEPDDATAEDPLVAMPFFGVLRSDSDTLDYEELVCRLYKSNGTSRDPDRRSV